ncbi:MAG TPA: IS21 family transposase [Chloroflexota bacterium]|nr:IS21 family transposase [Chloroflexota bacterium]
MDIVEVVRVLRAGASDRALTHLVGHNRRTIAKYRAWAEQQGLLQGPLPSAGEIQCLLARTLPRTRPPQQTSTLAPYQQEIAALRAQGVEMAAMRARLEERHGHPVSYSAVRRLVQHLEPHQPAAVVRVEVPPGSEAQVDFGYAGLTLDPATGQARKSWVFVLVLSWSRHLYAEVVFDQRVETWLHCHRHAFEAWGGAPERIVPDNLKAAIVRASFTEPLAQRAYRECAAHYGFLIDPTPPRTPRHKGKVEQGGVHYIARNFLAGRAPEPLDVRTAALWRWTAQTAGRRTHGTTKQAPLERFETVERAVLRPLAPTPYDPAIWKQATVARDCHLTFEGAYYSVPYRLVGTAVLLRGGARTVEIYDAEHQLVATHSRVAAGERQTHLRHLPAEKVPNLVLTREDCLAQARAIGPATTTLVQALLDHRPEDRLRSAGRLVRLAQRTTPARLEHACARALVFGVSDYPTIKRILQTGLDAEAAAPSGADSGAATYVFARPAEEFAASLLGGRS